MAANVLTLNRSVPMNWISAASQSIRLGSHDAGRQREGCLPGAIWRSTLAASANWRYPAEVKNSEPTKNVTPIPGRLAEAHCEAIPPRVKHNEPRANRTAIHQRLLLGR